MRMTASEIWEILGAAPRGAASAESLILYRFEYKVQEPRGSDCGDARYQPRLARQEPRRVIRLARRGRFRPFVVNPETRLKLAGSEKRPVYIEHTLPWAVQDHATFSHLVPEHSGLLWNRNGENGARGVGKVTSFTIKGMSKDNYFFGVRAIDKQGNKSQVSFPHPVR